MSDLLLFFVVKVGFVVSSMLCSGLIDHRIKNRTWNALFQGLLFSFLIFIDISVPFVAPNGTCFDVREVLLNISGVFYGPIAGGISTIFTLIYRAYKNTPGTFPALIGIFAIYLWIVAVYRISKPKGTNTSYKIVFLSAVITNLISVISVLVVPENRTSEPLIFSMGILFLYPPATVASAKIINAINERHRILKELVQKKESLRRKNDLLEDTLLKMCKQEQMIRRSEEMFRGLFLNSSDACFVLCQDKIVKTNRESRILLGADETEELDGASIMDYIPEKNRKEFSDSLSYVQQGEDMKNREFFIADKNGILIDVEGTMSCVSIAREEYIYLSLRDIRRRKLKEKEFVRSMQLDALTGAYNRGYLREYMKELAAEDYPVGIVMADLNGLKLTNDFLGHATGDMALVKAAETLRSYVSETGIIARMGGDEFVLFFPQEDATSMENLMARIRASLVHIKSDFGEISVSVGSSICMTEGEDLLKLISSADHDMYQYKAKESEEFKKRFLQTIYERSLKNNIFKQTYETRMTDLCGKLSDRLGVSEKERNELLLCCKYYDLGHAYFESASVMIPRVENTYNLLRQLPDMFELATDILYFPENWNGSGFHRMNGEQIPLVSRMLRIIRDYFYEEDLLYRSEDLLHQEEVRHRITELLSRRSGKEYDPALWAAFEEMMKK